MREKRRLHNRRNYAHCLPMGYLGKCFHRAFAGSVLFTDKVSIVGGVLAPAIFFARGEAMDSAYQGYVAWTILAVVGGGIALRLVTAPYFMWKDDQKEIAELRKTITNTSVKRRQFFEETFLAERANLAKSMVKFTVVDLPIIQLATVNPDAELKPLTEVAALFLADSHFKRYWGNFCSGFRWAIEGSKFMVEAGAKIPEEQKREVATRIIYDLAAMKASAEALVAILTEDLQHSEDYQKKIDELQITYSHLDREILPGTRWDLPSSLSTPNTASDEQ